MQLTLLRRSPTLKKRIHQVTFLMALAMLAIASLAFPLRSDVSANSKPLADFNPKNSVTLQGGFDPRSYYRLTTQWRGTGKSLDVVNDGTNNNQLILADTGNYEGQFWKITKVK